MSAAEGEAGRREDRLLGGRIRLVQPERGYRAAIDPVLLAAAVPARSGEHVLDLGAGVGAASLCLAARVPGCRVTGIELQPDLAALAAGNAEASGLADRVRVVRGDLLAPPPELEGLAGRFDHVMANPPYLKAGTHTPPPDAGRAAAHGEGEADLAEWVACCARMLRPRGTATFVHRADRFDELAALLRRRFGGIVLFPLWPRRGSPARRILVQARLGARSPAGVEAGLVLHEGSGYTAETQAVLRDAAALTLGPPKAARGGASAAARDAAPGGCQAAGSAPSMKSPC
jgi:tRNA1(Val) A37 N6-methylase TrmN6